MDEDPPFVPPTLSRALTFEPMAAEFGITPSMGSFSAPRLSIALPTVSTPPLLSPPQRRCTSSFHIAGVTDPGGAGKNNQDEYFIWNRDERNFCVGVFDGHGREMGSIASQVAAKVVASRVAQPGQLELIASDPDHQMQLLFDEAHVAIEDAFKEYYVDQGWVVDKNVEGYLVKRRKDGSADYCIHGGSTGTVVVVVDGHKLIVGNVGDSSAITDMSLPECHSKRWSLSSPSASSFEVLLHPSSPGLGLGTTTPSTSAISGNTGTVSANSSVPTSPVPMHYQHLTIDHSPDDINEFERVLKFRPSSRRKGFPEVLFVYDALSSSKHACPDIYNMKSDGSVVATNKGKYYKNVRSEWASLITTPPYSRFQDALAFTRSLGDFHLHTYGVSHEPAVQCYDLFDIPQGSTAPHTMIVASDGIWDNWKYEDAIQYCTDSRRVEQVVSSRDATVATKAFMNQNIMYAL